MKDIEKIKHDLLIFLWNNAQPIGWKSADEAVEEILKITGLLEETPINYPDDTK